MSTGLKKVFEVLVSALAARRTLAVASALAAGACVAPAASAQQYVVYGYNELGMHCMNQDFSELMILPPFNSIRAQVIRKGEEPSIITSGVTLRYSVPGNTHSSDKTNFWTYSQKLFGVAFPPDVGLAGFGLKGTMVSRTPTAREFEATGIPVTPVGDDGRENPYPMAQVEVVRNGAVVAKTQFVVPVSWEISCNLCHTSTTESVGMNILRAHDRLHSTQLAASTPVNCSGCHADPALGAPGQAGVSTMSSAMHLSHATRVNTLNMPVNCYSCHPGVRTQCQRDVHSERGMTCFSCHGQMADVGNPARTPWVTEPRCATCHQSRKPEFDFEPAGVLFKNATGHGGVKCVTCHSSPHAMGPTTTTVDNLQAIRAQGHSGPLGSPLSSNGAPTASCSACHTTPPGNFEHKQD
jgi:hypothetical protein